MLNSTENRDGSFRVWVASYRDFRPTNWSDIPPEATALEPAEPHCMTRREAALYVEAFNRAMLEQSKRLWALPVQVTPRLDGDLSPGEPVASDMIATELLGTSPTLSSPTRTTACDPFRV